MVILKCQNKPRLDCLSFSNKQVSYNTYNNDNTTQYMKYITVELESHLLSLLLSTIIIIQDYDDDGVRQFFAQ